MNVTYKVVKTVKGYNVGPNIRGKAVFSKEMDIAHSNLITQIIIRKYGAIRQLKQMPDMKKILKRLDIPD